MKSALIRKLALSAATLAALVLVLEVATRLLTPLGPGLIVADPEVGWRYLPSFEDRVYVPEADREVLLRFHRDGFRGADRPYDKTLGIRRVAVLGDSFVLAAGVDEEKTLVARLEALLNGHDSEHRWEVLNFGTSGSSTGQELALYRALVRRYQPDVVVCAFAVINDLADNSRRLTSSAGVYFELDDERGLRRLPAKSRSAASTWLTRHSRFYAWQKSALRELRFRLRQGAGVLKPGKWIFSTDSDSGDLAHAWTLLDRLVETFAREVEAEGSRFALALIPAPEQIYDDRWQQVLRNARDSAASLERSHPEDRIGEITATAGVPLVTMADRFRADAPAASLGVESEWLFLGGIGHLNERGNQIAAEALFEWLVAESEDPFAAALDR